MQRLIAAGILYLLGVAIILVIKPSLMFTDDGSWKEFGIGRNVNTHTWMPFWFFAILWALISYIIVTIVFSVYMPQKQSNVRNIQKLQPQTVEIDDEVEIPAPVLRRRGKAMQLPDGYYLMNADGTEASGGIPKYIYLGKGLPS